MPEPKDIDAEIRAAMEFIESDGKRKDWNCEWKGYIYGAALALAWASQSDYALEFLRGGFVPRVAHESHGPVSSLVEYIRSRPHILAFVRGEEDQSEPERHPLGMFTAPKEMHLQTVSGCVTLKPGDVVVSHAEVFRRESLDALDGAGAADEERN